MKNRDRPARITIDKTKSMPDSRADGPLKRVGARPGTHVGRQTGERSPGRRKLVLGEDRATGGSRRKAGRPAEP